MTKLCILLAVMFIVLESDRKRQKLIVPYKTTWICRVAEILVVKRPVHTLSQMPFGFFISPSCFTERDDNQDVSLKTTHWIKAKSNFLPIAEFTNMTALVEWACLLICVSRKIGSHSYCHKCFSPVSMLLTLNMLLGTSSEQHGLLRKIRIISVLAPLSGIRTSSATNNGRQCPCC